MCIVFFSSLLSILYSNQMSSMCTVDFLNSLCANVCECQRKYYYKTFDNLCKCFHPPRKVCVVRWIWLCELLFCCCCSFLTHSKTHGFRWTRNHDMEFNIEWIFLMLIGDKWRMFYKAICIELLNLGISLKPYIEWKNAMNLSQCVRR